MSKPFYLGHSDIWGPARLSTLFGARWFIRLIYDHARVRWVYLMKDKYEASAIFKQFYKLVLSVFQSYMQILRTDNGREYFITDLNKYLIDHGIFHQSSCAYTSQQNGMAEGKNSHNFEVA